MSHSLIDVRSIGRVRVITLNRAAKRNAINSAMADALHLAWQDFQHCSDRVAVLRAEGPVFTAGLDLKDPPAQFWQAIPDLPFALGKPVVGAVQGPVIAAGVSMLAFCDLCVASEGSSFSYPEARLGTAAGLITSLIPRMPHKVAMELLLLGQPISAQRAYEAGLVNRLCAADEVTAVAMRMAHQMADSSPTVLRFLKQGAREALARAPVESMVMTQYAAQAVAASADAREGVLARHEQRPPRFWGR
jgi:enoyl-CoA hydratase